MSDFDPYHIWLGIPETERPISIYRLLAITDFENNTEAISTAAERQTVFLRTLQAGEHSVLVAELLNEVSQARVTLLNADQKAEYDAELRKQQTPEPEAEPTPPPIPVVQTPSPTPVVVRGTVTQEFPVSIVQPAKIPRRKRQKEIWKQPAVIGISVVGAIGVLVLFISQMSPGDAEPVASNTPGRFSAERAVEKAAVEKADAEKAVTVTTALGKGDWKEVLALDPGNIEGLRLQDAAEVQAAEVQAAEENAAAEKAAAERAAADKAAADKAAAEKAAAERAAAERAAADKAAADKAAAEKAAAERAAADKAAAVTAALGKRDWKTVLAIDADNIEGKQMQAAALEIIARAPIANRIGMKLKLIPAGTFMMGSPETEKNRGDGEHQHEVTISKAFYIQTTEVTQRQWRAVMGTEPWKGQELSKYVKEGPNYPVAYISWDAAVAYCKILSQAVGKTYRLPTEAEWEYACRAGTPTAWSFGDDEKALGDYAWYKENASDIVSEQYAHQVGLKKPNAFGLYDMHGNVYEWCHDYYGGEYYKQSPEKDPTGPTSGSFPVLRGGAWLASTRDTRSARRDRGGAGGRRDSYGFRLVRELDSKEKAAAAAAALAKGDWKQALALDPDNSQGLRLKATAITSAIAKGDWKTVLELDATNSDGLRLRAAAEKATNLAGDPITNTLGMKLKLIPAGTFMMGSPETEKNRGDDEHQHKVTISKAFYMQTTEITQGQWKALMGTKPWKGHDGYSKDVKEGVNYPAVYMSWNDAIAFCENLSAKEGRQYRLPTEAEWEYACRAGSKTTWSFGDDEKVLGDYAWYDNNTRDFGQRYAHQVGLKKPNAFGLYDMHGNVWEHCRDYFGEDYYKQSPEKDPTGPASGSFRVVRSLGSVFDGRQPRNALRDATDGRSRNINYGFRLIRELD